MSRIGKQPIPVPNGVEVTITGQDVTVKGSKGTLSRTLSDRISIVKEEASLIVGMKDESRQARELFGLSRTLVNNMVIGVTEGFSKVLKVVGVGYRATAKGKDLEMQLGFSHNVMINAPENISFLVGKDNSITISGINKEVVGQVAANIRMLRKPEPYKGKGVMYTDERIIRKAGKKGGK